MLASTKPKSSYFSSSSSSSSSSAAAVRLTSPTIWRSSFPSPSKMMDLKGLDKDKVADFYFDQVSVSSGYRKCGCRSRSRTTQHEMVDMEEEEKELTEGSDLGGEEPWACWWPPPARLRQQWAISGKRLMRRPCGDPTFTEPAEPPPATRQKDWSSSSARPRALTPLIHFVSLWTWTSWTFQTVWGFWTLQSFTTEG